MDLLIEVDVLVLVMVIALLIAFGGIMLWVFSLISLKATVACILIGLLLAFLAPVLSGDL